jgi:hypothetical protein
MFLKKISLPSLFIGMGSGFVLGLLIMGLFVNYLISGAISGKSTDGSLFGGAIDQVREGIATVNQEKTQTSVYGRLFSIGGGTLVLEVSRRDGDKRYTFIYDDATTFVYIGNDLASSELPLSSDSIEVGTGLNIFTNEPIGSVENQYAVKVIKI